MPIEKHKEMVKFIWSICNLLRGPYKRNEYRKVILPLTVLRRFDCVLAPTKEKVLVRYNKLKGKSENIIRPELNRITGFDFYNLSKLNFERLLDDPNHIAQNLNSYINTFSKNIRDIIESPTVGIILCRKNREAVVEITLPKKSNIHAKEYRVIIIIRRGVLQYALTNKFKSPSQTIGSIIRGFKSTTTKQINVVRNTQGEPVWHRNYHDHIIRDNSDLNRIREYVINNPLKWQDDKYYIKDGEN